MTGIYGLGVSGSCLGIQGFSFFFVVEIIKLYLVQTGRI